MLQEISPKLFLVKIRLESKDLLRNLLILAFDPLQFSLSGVEMQTPCLELNHLH